VSFQDKCVVLLCLQLFSQIRLCKMCTIGGAAPKAGHFWRQSLGFHKRSHKWAPSMHLHGIVTYLIPVSSLFQSFCCSAPYFNEGIDFVSALRLCNALLRAGASSQKGDCSNMPACKNFSKGLQLRRGSCLTCRQSQQSPDENDCSTAVYARSTD
jgi:hypothetical protein